MTTFRILIFRGVSLLGRFADFIPAKQRIIKTVQTSNFEVAAVLMYRAVQLACIVQLGKLLADVMSQYSKQLNMT